MAAGGLQAAGQGVEFDIVTVCFVPINTHEFGLVYAQSLLAIV